MNNNNPMRGSLRGVSAPGAASAAMPRPLWQRLAIGLLGGVLACSAAAQGTWSKLTTSGPAMSARSTPAAAAIGPHVYLFGGVHDDLGTSQFVFFNDRRGGRVRFRRDRRRAQDRVKRPHDQICD